VAKVRLTSIGNVLSAETTCLRPAIRMKKAELNWAGALKKRQRAGMGQERRRTRRRKWGKNGAGVQGQRRYRARRSSRVGESNCKEGGTGGVQTLTMELRNTGSARVMAGLGCLDLKSREYTVANPRLHGWLTGRQKVVNRKRRKRPILGMSRFSRKRQYSCNRQMGAHKKI